MTNKTLLILKFLGKFVALFILIPLFFISLQYFGSDIYDFKRNSRFRGDSIYNPYKDIDGEWFRANFHAHSTAWGGVTHGNQPVEKVYEYYYKSGYDIVSISNYQQIAPHFKDKVYIPTYEHGLNILQNHHIVINARDESFSDCFLIQNAHQKQHIIKKLREKGGLIAIAHPRIRGAFKKEDMWKLRGYDMIEVLNHYKNSFSIWDAALSSGNLCWLLANDDSHNVYKENETFINWTMIGAEKIDKKSILRAMKKGCHYGVNNRENHVNSNYLKSAKVNNNKVTVMFEKTADSIKFISDHGVLQKIVVNSNKASYKLSEENTYVRVKAETNKGSLYLNPFFRYNGYKIPTMSKIPEVNIPLTILYRIEVLLLSSLNLFLILLLTGNLRLQRSEKRIRIHFRSMRWSRR